jgi:hypothetical protein
MLNLTIRDKYELYIGFVIMILLSIVKLKLISKDINMYEIIISVGFIIISKIILKMFMREVDKQLKEKKKKKK